MTIFCHTECSLSVVFRMCIERSHRAVSVKLKVTLSMSKCVEMYTNVREGEASAKGWISWAMQVCERSEHLHKKNGITQRITSL